MHALADHHSSLCTGLGALSGPRTTCSLETTPGVCRLDQGRNKQAQHWVKPPKLPPPLQTAVLILGSLGGGSAESLTTGKTGKSLILGLGLSLLSHWDRIR